MQKLLIASLGLLLASPAEARPLRLFGAEISGEAATIATRDESIVGTLTHVAENAGAFFTSESLAGPLSATVTYLGVPHSLRLEPTFSRGLFSLRVRSTGLDATFTGRTAGEVQEKMEDYLRANGLELIANFNAASAFESAFAITDGNPAATTASAARTLFFSAGVPPLFERGDGRFGAGGLAFSRGTLEATIAGQTYRGEQVRADASLGSWRVNERLRLELPVTGEYTEIAGTEVFGGGASLAATFTVLEPEPGRPFGWKLVPVAGVHGRVSFDAVAGGLSWHVGLINVLEWRCSERLSVSWVSQATLHRALPIDLGDYSLDPDIDQVIVKNGLVVTGQLSRSMRAHGYVVDTRFLRRASVPSYQTLGTAFELRLRDDVVAGVGVEADLAENYESVMGRVHFRWAW